MPTPPVVHLFAGPSLFGTPYQNVAMGQPPDERGIVWMPPARRGDAEALRTQPPGVLALADGTFHSYPSISHFELRELLQRGWAVYGLCSMGAIRACEMQHLGMQPWGQVARLFCDQPQTPDDEVALVHGDEAPFLPVSEPLVHLREFLTRMHEKELLGREQADAVAASLQHRWYGERTLGTLASLLREVVAGPALGPLLQALADFGPYRLKQHDLVAFVHEQPWRQAAA